MELNLGRVAFLDRGVYSALTSYNKWDFVTTVDSCYLYINTEPSIGIPITNTDYWKCIADGKPSTLAAAAAAAVTEQSEAFRDEAEGFKNETEGLKNTVQGLHDTVVEDAEQVALDRITTGEDAAQTALDRIATGQDAQTATEKAQIATDKAAQVVTDKNYTAGYMEGAQLAEQGAQAAEAQTLLYRDAAAAIVSGGPKGVYATASALISANPDHAYTYVVTADGKWYYWNGSTFVAGGVYQTPLAIVGTTGTSETSVMHQKAVTDNFDVFYEDKVYQRVSPSYTNTGQALLATGALQANAGYKTQEYDVTNIEKIRVSGRSPGPAAFALAVSYDVSNNVTGVFYSGFGTDYVNVQLSMPPLSTKLRVMQDPPTSGDAFSVIRTEKDFNYWRGKELWWCGTSIPAGKAYDIGSDEIVSGNYPKQVGINLGATVVNTAVGGSMCRANVRTGNYVGANFTNITSCLSMTNAEVEYFISNYNAIKGVLTGTVPASLSAYDITRLRAASFENKLLPYLNGTLPMPDLFVIDHGHNDYKYTLSNGSTDIGLEPTVANITSGELAEDTHMTANSNAIMETFMGSLANIPSAKKAEFIASLNRNCFIGSVNFIITLILRYNPKARILFVSNYEYENGDFTTYAPVITAQENLSKSWAFPLCKVYDSLGFSNHIIPNSMAWFNSTYPLELDATTDVTVFRSYCPDTVHPHTDVTGLANSVYAGILSEFIKAKR